MKRLVVLCLCIGLLVVGCGKRGGTKFNGKTAEEWAQGLERENKSQTKIDALTALREIAEKGNELEAIRYLMIGVSDPVSEVRFTAIHFLGGLGPKAVEALPELKKVAKEFLEKDPATADAADKAIEKIEAKPEGADDAKAAEAKPEEKK